MRINDLHLLPKIRDSWSYLYAEHCRIDQEAKAVALHDQFGKTPVPCASLALLMLGPGTKITHAAIMTLADNGCLVAWCGEHGVRFYASGMGETRQSANLIRQAKLCSHTPSRLKVVRQMYAMRFTEKLDDSLTLQQIRGKEGVRVRDTYAQYSKDTGVPWNGRQYNRDSWQKTDPVNRALSCANSCLYGVCHAAIISMGLSPGHGFVHTGKQLSFVYDIADLYKVDVSIPVAFQATAESTATIEKRIRHLCRDRFNESQILARIAKDLTDLIAIETPPDGETEGFDSDPAKPGNLWDPETKGGVEGGIAYGDNPEQEEPS